MKKILLIIACFFLLYSQAWAAGSCTQELISHPFGGYTIKFLCKGDAATGSIPNTAVFAEYLAAVKGLYLYTISAFPTVGGTAPDAADVFILDTDGQDLLGSVDGSTTANKGLALIHATLKKTTFPYSNYLSMFYYPAVMGTLTLKVTNQATVSANYTIELVFVR